MILTVTLAALLAAPLQATPAPATTYNGREHQTRVAPPRLNGDITMDGKLEEPQWKQAARLTGFRNLRRPMVCLLQTLPKFSSGTRPLRCTSAFARTNHTKPYIRISLIAITSTRKIESSFC